MAKKKAERVRSRVRVVIAGVTAGFSVNGTYVSTADAAIAAAAEQLAYQLEALRPGPTPGEGEK